MAYARAYEKHLTAEERALVAQTRRPEITELKDAQLRKLVKQLRERRDRARDTAQDRRRAKPQAGGGRAAGGDSEGPGAQKRRGALVAAVKRANKELERRRSLIRAVATRHLRQALRRKSKHSLEGVPESRTAGMGMANHPNDTIPPSGALAAEGAKPALKRASGR